MTPVEQRTPPAYLPIMLYPMKRKGYYGTWTNEFYDEQTGKKIEGVTHWQIAISRTILTQHYQHTNQS